MAEEKGKFKKAVLRVVKLIPVGKVVSYGQVALYIGIPRSGRQVGWVLNRVEEKIKIPWWRVVNNQGRISIKGSRYTAADQKNLLINEGIEVKEDLTFDINKYRFIPSRLLLEELGLDPFYIQSISSKIPYSNFFPN